MVKDIKDWRPEVWKRLVEEAVKTAYEELNTTKPPHSREDVDKVLIEAGASALLGELLRHHSCYLEAGEKYQLERPDHTDLIEGPGWFILIPND